MGVAVGALLALRVDWGPLYWLVNVWNAIVSLSMTEVLCDVEVNVLVILYGSGEGARRQFVTPLRLDKMCSTLFWISYSGRYNIDINYEVMRTIARI